MTECDKVLKVILEVEHRDGEYRKETVKDTLYWDNSQACHGWCLGVHISAMIERLFNEDKTQLKKCFDAVKNCADEWADDNEKTDG